MRQLAASKDGFEVPLTPLIDVVFLLLIFFLVATTFTRKEYDQQVDLPGGSNQLAAQPQSGDMLVNIRRDGTLVIDGRVLARRQLKTEVSKWQSQSNGGRVLLRADSGVDYGRVVEVLEICRGCGVRQLGLPVTAGGAENAR